MSDYDWMMVVHYREHDLICYPRIVWGDTGDCAIGISGYPIISWVFDRARRNNHMVNLDFWKLTIKDIPNGEIREPSAVGKLYGRVHAEVVFLRETIYTVIGSRFSLQESTLIAPMGRLRREVGYENWQHYRHHYLFEMETQESRALCSR